MAFISLYSAYLFGSPFLIFWLNGLSLILLARSQQLFFSQYYWLFLIVFGNMKNYKVIRFLWFSKSSLVALQMYGLLEVQKTGKRHNGHIKTIVSF